MIGTAFRDIENEILNNSLDSFNFRDIDLRGNEDKFMITKDVIKETLRIMGEIHVGNYNFDDYFSNIGVDFFKVYSALYNIYDAFKESRILNAEDTKLVFLILRDRAIKVYDLFQEYCKFADSNPNEFRDLENPNYMNFLQVHNTYASLKQALSILIK